MKFKLLFLLTLYTTLVFSQQEASVWCFGSGAGLKFNPDGSVTTVISGVSAPQGCSTISDSNGSLLFYSNGVTIWNKIHQPMVTYLLGDYNATQTSAILQKPGTTNLYYLFTLDVGALSNGLRYTEVDMNLNNGLGGVTANRNVLIYTPTCEKITIVKHANGTDYWVITHGWKSNAFYAHLVTANGISTNPVISNTGTVINNSMGQIGAIGNMKISPDGTKLIVCNTFFNNAELFDFNTTTGIVSNPNVIINSPFEITGAEFSSNSTVLYVSEKARGSIFQFDLTSANIASTKIEISTSGKMLGSLQLAINNKIYIASWSGNSLDVINDPNISGLGCNFQMDGLSLGGTGLSMLGLPSFCQSYFNPSFTIKNVCLGTTSEFTLSASQTITSASWDFGDGNASNAINPTHTYAATGTYSVSVTATNANGTSAKTKDITIYQIPTATKPQDILVCDDNNDGLHTFDLTTQNIAILNGQDTNLFAVTYFANNEAITSPSTYINTVPYQQETITAEVSNKANGECKSSTTFTIDVFDTPLPNLPALIPNLTSCDNTSIGSDSDGKVVLNLTQRASSILNGQSATQFLISYYKDAGLTQPILIATTYQNTNPTETIYVKVTNKDNLNCLATTSFKIEVFALPVITSVFDLKQCDDNIDGFSVFNLEEAISKITANAATETITFYKTQTDAQNNTNPIPNATTYTNQIVSVDKVYVRVSNSNGCYRIAQLNLIVSTTQIPLNFTRAFTQCDDAVLGTNKDGIASFDFSNVTSQIQNIFPVGQQLDITYYRNLGDALAEKNTISNISNYRNIGYPNTQNIYIRVDSRLNNDCLGLGSHITLNAESIPVVKSIIESHCDDNQDGVYAFDTSGLQTKLLNGLTNVTIAYFDQNNNLLSSPLPNPFTTASQTLKVVVTNNTPKACSFDSAIQFIVYDLPEAFPVPTSLTTVCDDEADPSLQDRKYAFDTSTFQTTILKGQTGMTVNYFDGNNNPLSSPLPNPFLTATQNVKVEVINPINTNCTATVILPFVVNPVPKINLLGDELVCSNLPTFTKVIDASIQDGSPTSNYNYVWYFNGNAIADATNYTLTVNTEGIYTVEVTNDKGCSRIRTITVLASDIAKITDVNIVDLVDSNSITISVSGSGDYVYSLDNEYGDYQIEPFFSNVSAGIHTIFVKDLNGCGVVPKEVAILGIPDYFTPNEDGYNDTWNIKGVNTTFNAKTSIHIFDRYGKLLKQISPIGEGWNGTFDGLQMPSDDYWYSIQLEDGRIMKGHFSLKR
ncbi:T9SS type B sorting domain-containing protein [Flavobacterium sp. ZB4R12]|uniref:T9SS type B sorting domain-containing protein n=1 Tax=Flavobacterium sp. ZB4R12 TaxID=3398732 RepID=UPI003AAD6736